MLVKKQGLVRLVLLKCCQDSSPLTRFLRVALNIHGSLPTLSLGLLFYQGHSDMVGRGRYILCGDRTKLMIA